MGYELISEAMGETLRLSSREWEMLRALAAQPAGWEPEEDRDYSRGSIPAEEALEMAESVKLSLQYLWREPSLEQAGVAQTVPELLNSLGYVEGDPFTFFGDVDRRRKVETFIRLASAGVLEIFPQYSVEG